MHFDGTTHAPPEVVYDLLADLRRHLDWAGERQNPTTRLLSLQAPAGLATVGTEFSSTGSDGKVARWRDRSVVTEATRPRVFEFVTEGVRAGKPGSREWHATSVHRYEIHPAPEGSRVTYDGQDTRLDGAPAPMTWPVVRSLVIRMSSKYMRRGFDGLLALADETASNSREGRRDP
jgi:hypothetical protein